MKERNKAIDTISGFFILEIIIQHVLQNSELYEGSFFEKYIIRLLPAFMPWFYFKAGLMFKQPSNIKKNIKSRAVKLLYPFAVWSLIPCILVLPFFIYEGNMYDYIKEIVGSLYYAHGPFNTPLWFLPSFFFVYIIMYLSKGKYLTLLFISVILSYLFSKVSFKIPFGMVNLPLGVFFFALGTFFCNIRIKTNITLAIFFSIIYILYVIFRYSSLSFHRNELFCGTYLEYIIGISILLYIIYCSLQYKWSISILSNIGKNSIILYVAHAPIIIIIKKINECFNLNLDSRLLFGLYSISIIAILFFLVTTKKRLLFLYKL